MHPLYQQDPGKDEHHLLHHRLSVGFFVQSGDKIGNGDIDKAGRRQGEEIGERFMHMPQAKIGQHTTRHGT